MANELKSVSDLLGRTLAYIENVRDQHLIFKLDTGERCMLHHAQDCCESVTIEDVAGDLQDLVGAPLLMAEESTSKTNPDGVTKEFQDSFTWTFYRFATVKGYVTVRWYGESNGCYSESVDFLDLDAID